MAKLTLKDRLIRYLKNQGTFVASGELQRLADQAGYSAQNAGRRLRECVEDGILEVEYREKNHAYYRYMTKVKQVPKTRIVERNGVPVAEVYYEEVTS